METKGYYLEESEGLKKNLSTKNRIASVAGGAYLLSSGLNKLFPPSIDSLLRIAGGAYLIYRGSKGYCPVTEALTVRGKVLNIRETLIINRPKDEVYALWRNLENLPRFMKHLAEVKVINEKYSVWKAKIPGGIGNIEWEAEILIDRNGEEISWRSVEDSLINNSGKVTFEALGNGLSTELHTTITYSPPAGDLGKAVAKLLNNTFEELIRNDLKRFKEMAENTQSLVIDTHPKNSFSNY